MSSVQDPSMMKPLLPSPKRNFASVCLSVCLFVCLSVCEQLPDHNFSCGVMKLAGINCCVKIWK